MKGGMEMWRYTYSNEIYHFGIKGMKWGIRRFQNKDGSRTLLGKRRRASQEKVESSEEKRARLLKSTNAEELYKNRKLLSTNELNERINRIQTEQRLSELSAKHKQTGMDKVNDLLKWGNKVNEIYQFTQTPVMKALKKKMLGEAADGFSPKLDKVMKNLDKMSDNDLNRVLKRANTEKAVKKLFEDQAAEVAKQARKQVDDYNEQIRKQREKEVNDYIERENSRKTGYSMNNSELYNRGRDYVNNNSILLLPAPKEKK